MRSRRRGRRSFKRFRGRMKMRRFSRRKRPARARLRSPIGFRM